MKILLSGANLHDGGAVAVGASIITALSRMDPGELEITVLASREVDREVRRLGADLETFSSYRVEHHGGLIAIAARLSVDVSHFDSLVNIFGPVYSVSLARGSVTGFAQPWIAFPRNAARRRLDWRTRLLYRVKYPVQTLFFLLPRTLVVEQEEVRRALRHRLLFHNKDIRVVPNVVDAIHTDPSRWEELPLPPSFGPRVGVVARNYPHKNLEVLPSVRRILRETYGVNAQFLVTLPEEDWATTSSPFKAEMTNVGSISLAQIPTFYRSIDVALFPTLLECFSATPLEARTAGIPLIASDIPVVRETVGDYAIYVNPLSPEDIAAKLAEVLQGPDQRASVAEQSDVYSASDRAKALLELAKENAMVKGRVRVAMLLQRSSRG